MHCPSVPYLFVILLLISGISIITYFTNFFPYEIRAFFLKSPQNFTFLSRRIGLECWRIFEKDKEYMNFLKANRITYNESDDENVQTDCKTIRKRSFASIRNSMPDEEDFPIAFAKIVYKDYFFLEMELSVEYAPQNFYCFSIDLKASNLFKEQLRNLSNCLPNVFISQTYFDTDSTGHNHNHAYVDCFRELLKYEWKYVVLMQNHDIILRTNAELVQIFKWFNGANDISVKQPMMHRINRKFNWTFSALGLFKDSQRNIIGANGYPPRLTFAKGLVQTSISRAMVEFVINELNLENFMEKLQYKKPTSPEETMLATIHGTDAINAPGGFTHACLDRHQMSVSSITRKSIWGWDKFIPEECGSKNIRHGICIFGIEDIPKFETYPNILFNKMMPSFDFGAIACWHERLYNRSLGRNTSSRYKLNPNFYLNLPHVRFHSEKLANGKVDLEKFQCNKKIANTSMIKA